MSEQLRRTSIRSPSSIVLLEQALELGKGFEILLATRNRFDTTMS